MKNTGLKSSVILFVIASSLLLTGCCVEHEREVQYESMYVPAPPMPASPVPAPPRPAPSMSVSPRPAPAPVRASVTYPIRKVVDGKTHLISAYPTGVPATSLLLIERIAPVQVTLKQDFNYIINITNISRNTLHDVIVTEPYSAIFRYQSSQPLPMSHKEGTLVWRLGDMASQDTHTITMRGNAKASGRMSDCVIIAFRPAPMACMDVAVVNPSLKLAQTGPETVIQCDPIPVTLRVTNDGSGLARDVRIREELPDGLLTEDGRKVIAAQAGDLEPGEFKTLTVKLKALETGLYMTRAQATAQGDVSAYADYAVKVVRPMLVLTTSGPRKRYAGRTVQYDITVTNKGDGPANNLLVTEMIPPGATYISASDQGVPDQGMVVWNLGTLDPSASRKISVRIRLDEIGVVVNKVHAKAYCTFASAESETTVEGIPAILLEVIDLEDPIETGTNETYVIRVTNQGSAASTNVKVTAYLPDAMEYVASAGPTQVGLNGKIVSFVPLPSLAAKTMAEYRIEVKGVKTGDVRLKVELQSDQMSSPVMETESTNVY